MNRRQFVRATAAAAASLTAASCRGADPLGIHYEVHGPPDGIPLFLGFPIMASYAEIFGSETASVRSGYLERLTDRYRVLLVDYPNVGKTRMPPPAEMTADRVVSDLLAVVDAAGFDRFAYCGHLWGAINGLLLASRTDRVSALVCGTWPPLGAPYGEMLEGVTLNVANPPPHAMVVLRDANQYAQWVTYYQSLQGWPEAEAVGRITCPRLALVGAEAATDVAGIPLRLAEAVRERRSELEAMGWRVREVPGRDAGLMLDPAAMVPAVRDFLDTVT